MEGCEDGGVRLDEMAQVVESRQVVGALTSKYSVYPCVSFPGGPDEGGTVFWLHFHHKLRPRVVLASHCRRHGPEHIPTRSRRTRWVSGSCPLVGSCAKQVENKPRGVALQRTGMLTMSLVSATVQDLQLSDCEYKFYSNSALHPNLAPHPRFILGSVRG